MQSAAHSTGIAVPGPISDTIRQMLRLETRRDFRKSTPDSTLLELLKLLKLLKLLMVKEAIVSRIDTLRENLGGAHERAATKVKNHLEPYVQAFIRNAPLAVLATSNSDGDCDASPKGGTPGFIKVVDDTTLLIPDIGGNRLFQSYQNFESNPKAGLLFMIPGTTVTARVNGRISVLDEESLAAHNVQPELHNPDGNSGVVQGVLLHVDEAYFHCPRSMQFSELWDTKTIEANAQRSLKDLQA